MSSDPTRTDPASMGDGAAPEADARAGIDPASGPTGSDGGPTTPRRWRLGRVLLAVAGALALVVVGGLIYVHTESGRGRVQSLVVTQIANLLADDAEVEAASLEGNFLTGAQLTGLTVSRDGETVLAVDTVRIDYTLATLLRRTFSASELYVGGPRLVVRQRADSTLNVAGLLAPRDDEAGGGGLALRLDEMVVRGGAAEVRWLSADGDSVHAVRDLDVVVRDVVSRGDSLVGTIEALSLVAVAPRGRGEARVSGGGRISGEALRLDRLAIDSDAGTDVSGEARLAFGGEGTLPTFEAAIEAVPFALEDVRAFAGVPLYGDPRLRLVADSDGEALTASISGALDDATLTLDAELTRRTDAPVRYRAEGTLRRLDLGALTGNEALAGELTGDLDANLQGASLQALSGPFAVTLRESRLSGRRIDRLDLSGSFAAGRVAFDLDGALPGASLRAEGSARPFLDVPQFQLAGTADDVDLGLLLPGSGRRDRFAGDVAVLGRGTSLDTFSGTVALDLVQADIELRERTLRLGAVAVDADVAGGQIDFDATVDLPGGDGRIVGRGGLRLGGQPLTFDVTDGEAVGLNLVALTGNPNQESDLTGTFTLSGEGLNVREAPIDLAASVRDSRYGTYRVTSGDLAIQLRGGVAAIEADLDLGAGGQLTASGTARPFVQPLAFDLVGTMRNLDLAEVQDVPERYSDLTGTWAASGAGVDPATMTLDASVQITEPSSYGERLVDGGDLDVLLRGGALAVDGRLDTPEGGFDLALSGRPFDASPSYAFDNTCFSGLDLSALAEAGPRSDLNGCVNGRIDGISTLGEADGQGTVTLQPSTVNEAEIEGGALQFTLDGGALVSSVDVALGASAATPGRLVASVRGRPFDPTPTYAVLGRANALDVGTLLDLPETTPVRVTLAFDVEGQGTAPDAMAIVGSLRGGPSALGPARLDTLHTRFALRDGVLRLDTLAVDSDLLDASGGGTLALFTEAAASDFRLEGAVETIEPLAAMTERTLGLLSGTFSLAAQGAPGEPLRITGATEARQIVVDQYAVTGVDATLDATWDRARPDSSAFGVFDAFDGQLETSFSVLSTPALRVEQGRLTLGAEAGEFTIEGAVAVDDRRDLDFFARLEAETSPPTVLLERGRITVDDDTWQLRQAARITQSESGVEVRGLLLTSDEGGQQIAADGQIDFAGQQSFVVTVEGVAIDGLTDLVNLDALGGDLTATLLLSGPATAPVIDGTVTLAGLTSYGDPVGALDATLAYDGRNRLDVDAVVTHVDGEALTVRGFLPFQFSLADGPAAQEGDTEAGVRLVAQAEAFPIAWARPFLDDRTYTDLGGDLRLDLTIDGTQGTPRLDGVAQVSGGRLGVAATGRTYEPLEADVTFQGNRIVLDDVRILNGSGRTALDVTGTVLLRELSVGEFDLTITPDDFVAMNTRTYDGLVLDRGSQPLRLTGTLDRPVLSGAVVLAEGDIYLTDELVPPDLDPVELTDAQIREVEARFGRVVTARDTAVNRFTDALDYDLTVQIRRNVWLRAESGLPFDIEFEGDVQATKRPFAESSNLFGQIDLVRGSVETLNRRFEIERGTLTFNGPPLDAEVDLSAELDVRLPGSVGGQSSATVILAASGQFTDGLEVRLTSNPSLEQADIVSLIATGRLADEG
ncbi:MAG: translocation/assembly module TamB domain-containing protein, partial [Bacteroidota bacterium]